MGPARGSASSSWCRAVCPWSWRWLEVKASQSFSCWSWDPCLPRVRVGGRLVRPGRRDHETWLHRALGSIRSHPVSTSPFARSHSFWKNPFTIETVVLQSGLLSESFATWFQEQRDAWKTSSQPLPLAGSPAGMLEPRCPPCLQPSEQTPPHSWLLPGWSPPAAAASPGPALPCPALPTPLLGTSCCTGSPGCRGGRRVPDRQPGSHFRCPGVVSAAAAGQRPVGRSTFSFCLWRTFSFFKFFFFFKTRVDLQRSFNYPCTAVHTFTFFFFSHSPSSLTF